MAGIFQFFGANRSSSNVAIAVCVYLWRHFLYNTYHCACFLVHSQRRLLTITLFIVWFSDPPFTVRYLWPHKQDVTQVLAYVAQACHEHVPPEVLESLLMKIANNFVSERSAPEVMAVGINAIREISRRQVSL